MPLHQINNLSKNVSVGLWRIEEEIESLKEILSPYPNQINAVQHPKKLTQSFSCRILIKSLLEHHQLVYQGIDKSSSGKPFLIGYPHLHLSFSHTENWAAAIIHRRQACGIDIEKPVGKLLRIKHKFLSGEEENKVGDQLEKLCRYWCAKEAIYKIHGIRGISLKANIEIKEAGEDFYGELRYKNIYQKIDLQYFSVEDYTTVIAF